MLKYILPVTSFIILSTISTSSYALQRVFSTPNIFLTYKTRIAKLVKNNPHQLSAKEYTLIAQEVLKKAPCNLLVFGVGNDSSLWIDLNKGGNTVFLEDSEKWLTKVREQLPQLCAYLVRYNHKRKQWSELLAKLNNHTLFASIPPHILTTKWDIIFVDGPEGWSDEKPGRMSSIYMAALLAHKNKNSQVFIHDCDRQVEAVYASKFLQDKNLKQTVDRLCHYTL